MKNDFNHGDNSLERDLEKAISIIKTTILDNPKIYGQQKDKKIIKNINKALMIMEKTKKIVKDNNKAMVVRTIPQGIYEFWKKEIETIKRREQGDEPIPIEHLRICNIVENDIKLD